MQYNLTCLLVISVLSGIGLSQTRIDYSLLHDSTCIGKKEVIKFGFTQRIEIAAGRGIHDKMDRCYLNMANEADSMLPHENSTSNSDSVLFAMPYDGSPNADLIHLTRYEEFDFSNRIEIGLFSVIGDKMYSTHYSQGANLSEETNISIIDSVKYIHRYVDYLSVDSTKRANLIACGSSEEQLQALPDSAFDQVPYQDTRFPVEIIAQSGFEWLTPDEDTNRVNRDTISFVNVAFSPCNWSEGIDLTTDIGITIEYVCWKSQLIGYNKKGKAIWELDLRKHTDSFVKYLRTSDEEGYDVFVVFIDNSVYKLNSKNGKLKVYRRTLG